MFLSIYTIEGVLFRGEIKSLRCKTSLGEITVLDNHIPIVTDLKPGPLYYTCDKEVNQINLQGGILEVRPDNEAVILTNS